MYITSYSIRIILLSRYVNIYDTMAPMSSPAWVFAAFKCPIGNASSDAIEESDSSTSLLPVATACWVLVPVTIAWFMSWSWFMRFWWLCDIQRATWDVLDTLSSVGSLVLSSPAVIARFASEAELASLANSRARVGASCGWRRELPYYEAESWHLPSTPIVSCGKAGNSRVGIYPIFTLAVTAAIYTLWMSSTDGAGAALAAGRR